MDSNSDKENMGGNIEELSTSSPLEVIPVTTESIHVFPKDSTSIPHKVTSVTTEFSDIFPKNSTSSLLEVAPVITKLNDVLSENLLRKLPPTRDIQHVVDLILGARRPDLPHPRLNPIEKIEFEKQVDVSCH